MSRSTTPRRALRLGTVLSMAPTATVLGAAPAFAHVTAQGDAAGGDHHSAPAGTTDTAARWLAGAGLLVGALGLGVGAGAVLRSRGSGPAAAPTADREHSLAGR